MNTWLLIGATLAILYAFWIALNWTFDLIEWARRELVSERAGSRLGESVTQGVVDLSAVATTPNRPRSETSLCSCSRHWVDSRCPIHGWQYPKGRSDEHLA